ncbi:hornerin-like [Iris pallida]|uniref:Hornerin-like n=1 Tax=Iris pallida TaxID=29817 RepID=A0AAX6GIP1_IRIPA|nr:hornerin-like [Iris pallida]
MGCCANEIPHDPIVDAPGAARPAAAPRTLVRSSRTRPRDAGARQKLPVRGGKNCVAAGMRCRPNELIVASPGAGRPAPRPWTLVQRAYRCRLQRCSATRRLTTRCWKRANFLVVLGGAPGTAAKLTRFVLTRVEPYGSPRGYDSGSVRQPRVRPYRHVSGFGPASLGRLPASVQPTADAAAPSVGSRPRRRHPSCPCSKPDRIRETLR